MAEAAPTTPESEPYDVTLTDVARRLGVVYMTVKRWNERGEFDGLGIQLPGGARRFRNSEVEAYIERLRIPATPDESSGAQEASA